MTHVTCRLTAKNRDQLRNPTLGNRVWATFFTITCTATHRATQQLSLATTISRIAQHICMNGTLRRDFPDVARFCPPVCRITSRARGAYVCVLSGWNYGAFMCKATPFLQGTAVSASVNTLMAIAFDRSVPRVVWCGMVNAERYDAKSRFFRAFAMPPFSVKRAVVHPNRWF